MRANAQPGRADAITDERRSTRLQIRPTYGARTMGEVRFRVEVVEDRTGVRRRAAEICNDVFEIEVVPLDDGRLWLVQEHRGDRKIGFGIYDRERDRRQIIGFVAFGNVIERIGGDPERVLAEAQSRRAKIG
nr:hypothetical protein [Reyranella soli]